MAGIILNEDFENFMASYPPEKMTEAGLCEQIDHYSGNQVETLIFCGNGMRAMFDSWTWEPLWSGITETPDGRVFFRNREVTDYPLPVKSNVLNCKRLYTQCKNPFQTRINYARSKGIRVFAGMRMNDVHWATDTDFLMNSDFWRQHPEYRREIYQSEPWSGQGLDYAVPEVREHALLLIGEYLERFDFDGIELDWMRTPPHFKPGFEEDGLEILTGFMQEVKKIADRAAARSGHPVAVYTRVPVTPEDCRRTGLDVIRWVKKQLVDHVTFSCYFGVSDFDPPLELWRELLGDEISLAAGLDINVRQHLKTANGFRNTEWIVNGFASSFFHRGANKMYLFNHMDGRSSMYDKEGFRNVLDYCGQKETVEVRPRRHIVTYGDTPPQGIPVRTALPLVPKEYKAIRLNVGGGTANRPAHVVLFGHGLQGTEVRLNTVLCQESPTLPPLDGIPSAVGTGHAWSIPAGALHDGDNVLEFDQRQFDSPLIDWCEIVILPS